MIIEFRAHAVRHEPRLEAPPRGAQIIIFPGVRRERHAEAPTARRCEHLQPTRDRLELPDW